VILYTVLPEEAVLAGMDHPEDPGGGPARTERLTQVAGRGGPVRLILEQTPGGTWRIQRLVSSDPFDFLDPALSPGRTVPRRR